MSPAAKTLRLRFDCVVPLVGVDAFEAAAGYDLELELGRRHRFRPAPKSPWRTAPGRPGARLRSRAPASSGRRRARIAASRPCRRCRRSRWWRSNTRPWRLRPGDEETRSFSGQCGQDSALFSFSGGIGMISSWVTDLAPCRNEVPMQSEPVSPPPMTMTCLSLAEISWRADGRRPRPQRGGSAAAGNPWRSAGRRDRGPATWRRSRTAARSHRPAARRRSRLSSS